MKDVKEMLSWHVRASVLLSLADPSSVAGNLRTEELMFCLAG